MVKVIAQDGKFKVEGTFDFGSFAKKQQPLFKRLLLLSGSHL